MGVVMRGTEQDRLHNFFLGNFGDIESKGGSPIYADTDWITLKLLLLFDRSVMSDTLKPHGPLLAKKGLLFNMLSRLVIAFLPRSKHLLISWLQSPSAVILEPRKIVFHCFHCFPIYLLKVHLVKAMVFPVVMYGCESWTIKKPLSAEELIILNCGIGEGFWVSLGQKEIKQVNPKGN